MTTLSETEVQQALLRLDGWLQSMRAANGYSGPVAHWWESSLLYSGAMIDWRYEGIMLGYLALYQRTGQAVWLARAMQAGDDICQAQLPDGRFRNASFLIGPLPGGTPHEAAVDIALLALATQLKADNDAGWQRYFATAERNLLQVQIGRLWNGTAFTDQPGSPTMVPNKNATTMGALLRYEALSGRSMRQYIDGAFALIRQAQVQAKGPRQGGIIHLGSGAHRLAIGIYSARTAVVLAQLYETNSDPRICQTAAGIIQFLLRLLQPPGTLFGFYPSGKPIACPTWVSPSGDVLLALLAWRPFLPVPERAIVQLAQMLLAAQMPTGGLPTAIGLGHKGRVRPHQGLPDFRDLLPVVGWCDKAFRALATLAPARPLPAAPDYTGVSFRQLCRWRGQEYTYFETEESICLRRGNRLRYQWTKGLCYPDIFQL